jgi:hypothetical protein
VDSRFLLCRHHGRELDIPLYPPYRFFHRDYSGLDCGGMAFSEAKLLFTRSMAFSIAGCRKALISADAHGPDPNRIVLVRERTPDATGKSADRKIAPRHKHHHWRVIRADLNLSS